MQTCRPGPILWFNAALVGLIGAACAALLIVAIDVDDSTLILVCGLALTSLILCYHNVGHICHPFLLTAVASVAYFGPGLLARAVETGEYTHAFQFVAAIWAFTVGGCAASLSRLNVRQFTAAILQQPVDQHKLPSDMALICLWAVGAVPYCLLIARIGIPALSREAGVRLAVGGLPTTIFEIFWSVACAGLWAKCAISRTKRRVALAAVLTLLSIGLFSALLHRYASLQLMLVLWLLFAFVRRRAAWQLFIGPTIAFVALFVGMQIFRSSQFGATLSYAAAFELITRRLFFIGGKTLDLVFTVFPGRYEYLLGLTYVRRAYNALFAENVQSMGYFLATEVIGRDTGAYDPLSTIGEFYVNFGVPGLLLGMAVFGFAMQLACCTILSKKTVTRLTCFCMVAMFCIRTFAYTVPGNIYNLLVLGMAFAVLGVARIAGLSTGLTPYEPNRRRTRSDVAKSQNWPRNVRDSRTYAQGRRV